MDFFGGMKSYILGIRTLLIHSQLRKTAIMPLVISLLLFGVVTYFVCFVYLPTVVAGILAGAATGFWATALAFGAQTLAFLLGLIASGIITFIVGSWVASPFNALLAEKALIHFGGKKEVPFDAKRWLDTTLRMTLVGIVRSVILVVFGLLLTILSFIPLLHLPVLFIGFFIIATDCLDYSLETLEYRLRARFRYYSKNFGQISGFTVGLGLTFLVPGLSFLLMPAAIVGAAHLVANNEKKKS